MSRKLRKASVGLLVAAAIGSLAVSNATATEGGHFVTDPTSHALVDGFDGFGHGIHFAQHGLSGEVGCNETVHTTTITTSTFTELALKPTYNKCYTTGGGEPGSVTVDVNGCTYNFKVAANSTETTEQTGGLVCPGEASLKITHPNCTISIPPQNVNTGITYTKVVGPPDSITLDTAAEVSTFRHGLCQIITPTAGLGTIKGSLRIKAIDPKAKKELNLTAT